MGEKTMVSDPCSRWMISQQATSGLGSVGWKALGEGIWSWGILGTESPRGHRGGAIIPPTPHTAVCWACSQDVSFGLWGPARP